MREGEHSGLTMTVLGVICLFMVLFGVKALVQPFPEDALTGDAGAQCVTREIRKGERVRPDDVLVSVFNASGRGGLARETMSQLSQRGFHSGTEGNVKADEVRYAQVWADTPHDPAARLVAGQFGPTVKVKVGRDTSIGPGVVVVVGENFDELGNGPRSVRAAYDTEICSPPSV